MIISHTNLVQIHISKREKKILLEKRSPSKRRKKKVFQRRVRRKSEFNLIIRYMMLFDNIFYFLILQIKDNNNSYMKYRTLSNLL